VGFAAWVNLLQKLAALLQASPESRRGGMLGNAWIYECLVQFRRNAAVYLRGIAAGFATPAAAHLLKAAGLYERMANQVLCAEGQCYSAVAPYPWMLKEGEVWGSERIADEMERLQDGFSLEREVVHDLEQALALSAAREPA
jgi:hypothetical protein